MGRSFSGTYFESKSEDVFCMAQYVLRYAVFYSITLTDKKEGTVLGRVDSRLAFQVQF